MSGMATACEDGHSSLVCLCMMRHKVVTQPARESKDSGQAGSVVSAGNADSTKAALLCVV